MQKFPTIKVSIILSARLFSDNDVTWIRWPGASESVWVYFSVNESLFTVLRDGRTRLTVFATIEFFVIRIEFYCFLEVCRKC